MANASECFQRKRAAVPRRRAARHIIQFGSLGLLLVLGAACGKGSAAAEPSAADTIPVEVIAEHGVGDGHPATEVPIGRVIDLATDPAGNIYFVDAVHLRVRRIDPDGTGDGYDVSGGQVELLCCGARNNFTPSADPGAVTVCDGCCS